MDHLCGVVPCSERLFWATRAWLGTKKGEQSAVRYTQLQVNIVFRLQASQDAVYLSFTLTFDVILSMIVKNIFLVYPYHMALPWIINRLKTEPPGMAGPALQTAQTRRALVPSKRVIHAVNHVNVTLLIPSTD